MPRTGAVETRSAGALAAPGTIAWRLNGERLVLLGWSRAILLQFAHPLVAAGVADHSGFRASPVAALARLHHTVRAMLALTFGDEASRREAIDAILAIHRRVRGHLSVAVGPYAAGTPYSAEDPALVLWVHATLLDSVPLVYERLVAPLSLEERDTYCREAAPVAVALGAREAEVPQSWADLRRYLDRMYQSGGIVVGDTARALARAVTAPRGSLLVAPVRWANLVLTIGLLPPPIREQYRFAWGVRDERALSLLVAAIRAGRRVTPRQLALWKDARTM